MWSIHVEVGFCVSANLSLQEQRSSPSRIAKSSTILFRLVSRNGAFVWIAQIVPSPLGILWAKCPRSHGANRHSRTDSNLDMAYDVPTIAESAEGCETDSSAAFHSGPWTSWVGGGWLAQDRTADSTEYVRSTSTTIDYVSEMNDWSEENTNDNFSYEILLQKRLELLQRFDEHLKRSDEVRARFQAIDDDLQQRPQMKMPEIDHLRARIEQYTADLRAVQSESSALDRLMEESNTTITDSNTNRTLFFTVESRSIQSLVDMIENRVSWSHCQRWNLLRRAHCLLLHDREASKKSTDDV